MLVNFFTDVVYQWIDPRMRGCSGCRGPKIHVSIRDYLWRDRNIPGGAGIREPPMCFRIPDVIDVVFQPTISSAVDLRASGKRSLPLG